jgi:hypothetical protein
LKTIVNPILTFLLVDNVFAMEPLWSQAAVILSAMPTAANAYVIAQQYNVYFRIVSAAIAVSTGMSVVTIFFLLVLVWSWLIARCPLPASCYFASGAKPPSFSTGRDVRFGIRNMDHPTAITLKASVQSLVFVIMLAATLFGSAGRFDIIEFWVYVSIVVAVSVLSLIILDADLMQERMRPGGRRVGLHFLPIIIVMFLHWAVAGLDCGHLHLSDAVPPNLEVVALVLFALAGLFWSGRCP